MLGQRKRIRVKTGELVASSTQTRFIKSKDPKNVLYVEGMFSNRIVAKL